MSVWKRSRQGLASTKTNALDVNGTVTNERNTDEGLKDNGKDDHSCSNGTTAIMRVNITTIRTKAPVKMKMLNIDCQFNVEGADNKHSTADS